MALVVFVSLVCENFESRIKANELNLRKASPNKSTEPNFHPDINFLLLGFRVKVKG